MEAALSVYSGAETGDPTPCKKDRVPGLRQLSWSPSKGLRPHLACRASPAATLTGPPAQALQGSAFPTWPTPTATPPHTPPHPPPPFPHLPPPPSPGPHMSPPPAVCTICLDPITLHSATHRSEALWPGCRHPYHLACLARTRARMPNPVCALCRQPWPPHEDSALSLACNCRHQPLLSSRVLDGKVIVIVYLPNMWQVECRYITCKLT